MECFVQIAEDDKTTPAVLFRTSYDRYDMLCNILQEYCWFCQGGNEMFLCDGDEKNWRGLGARCGGITSLCLYCVRRGG